MAPLLLAILVVSGCSGSGGEVERIVLVTFDTTRADRFGVYGSERGLTPRVDAFAEQAVVFEQAVSPVPTTLPSHSTMFTGVYPQDHGVHYNIVFRLGEQANTLAEALSASGYRTGGFPASFILAERFGLNQGFDTYAQPPKPDKANAEVAEAVQRSAEEGVDLALDWLAQQPEAKSFNWLHFYDAHAPYKPPFPYSAKYRDQPYDGEIAYMDTQFGRFLDGLRQSPKWDKTLLIVVGDHGEGLHDHSERYHSYLLYQQTQHVPMIVRAPGFAAGRVAEPVTLADLMPTILDLAGVEVPEGLRGISLRGALGGESPPRRDIYFESIAGALNYGWSELQGLRDGRWKLIDAPREAELFDLHNDPLEQDNLASIEPARFQELKRALEELKLPLSGSTAAEAAHDEVLDPETEALLISLGYTGSSSGGAAEDGPHPKNLIGLEGELTAARQAVQSKRWSVVEEQLGFVLERDPGNRWALQAMVMALLSLDRPEEAEFFAQDLLKRNPGGEKGYALTAQTLNARGLLDEARTILRSGLEILPDSEQLIYLALTAAFEQQDPEGCGDLLATAIDKHATSSRLLVVRARCEAREGQAESSLATLQEAVELGLNQLDILSSSVEMAPVLALPGFAELQRRVDELKERVPGESDADEAEVSEIQAAG